MADICVRTGHEGGDARQEWLPRVADRYPLTDGTTPTDAMIRLLHHPERLLWPELAAYPAHLHIDLLPEYQRSGFYDRLGFHQIPVPDPAPLTYLGRRITASG